MSQKSTTRQNQTTYGDIKRARDFYLYTQNGTRLIDLSMDNGFAPLGHKAHRYSRAIKKTIDKGLWGNYPEALSLRRCERLVETFLASLFSESNLFARSWYLMPLPSTVIQDVYKDTDYILWCPYEGMKSNVSAKFRTQDKAATATTTATVGIVLPFEWARHWGICVKVHSDKNIHESLQAPTIPTTPTSVELALIYRTLEFLLQGFYVRPPVRHHSHRTDVFVHRSNFEDEDNKNIVYVSKQSHNRALRGRFVTKEHRLTLPNEIKRKGAFLCLPELDKARYLHITHIAYQLQIYLPPSLRVLVIPQWVSGHDFEKLAQFFEKALA